MPIIVDPTFTPPPPPESVTSADGHLTVVADNVNGGALLVANFAEQVHRVNYATDPQLVGDFAEWDGLEYIDPQFSRAVLPDGPQATTSAFLGGGDPTGTFTRTIDGGQP